jgi:outer membrane protein OmpA-like peptidoglycan-associated protein
MKFYRSQEKDEYWISISDMMSGLMLVFLFIAVAYMSKITDENEQYIQVVQAYDEVQDDLYQELFKEFHNDLSKWNAALDRKTLSIRFNEPEVLFEKGEAFLKPLFRLILDDFFPRYLEILGKEKYKNRINEIRIEGHTSSEWLANTSPDLAYKYNMRLSQERSAMVLDYGLNIFKVQKNEWVRKKLVSVGYSSSKPKNYSSGIEDPKTSRRVEFRVITHAEKQIYDIMKIHNPQKYSEYLIDENDFDLASERELLLGKARDMEKRETFNENIERQNRFSLNKSKELDSLLTNSGIDDFHEIELKNVPEIESVDSLNHFLNENKTDDNNNKDQKGLRRLLKFFGFKKE